MHVQILEKVIRFHWQAFIVYKNGENLKMLIEIFCQKLIVSNVSGTPFLIPDPLLLLVWFYYGEHVKVTGTKKSCCQIILHHIFQQRKMKYVNGIMTLKSSHPKLFLRKGVLKICSKFTGVHP